MNLQPSVTDGPAEWEGHALIARNICPLHQDQPADACDHGCTWLTPTPSTEPVPYDASVEDRHEHGFTFREGLGYLADDPFCDGCCELATAKWKSSLWPVTDAEKVTADVDAKTAEAGDL